MPQFPAWEQQVATWTDAVQLRQSQLNQAVSDLVAQARDTTTAVVDEIRRRVNLLDLATRRDVETQSRLGRNRVSFVLQEFLDAQRSHDEALLESLRTELREELQGFAAAIDDNLFAVGGAPPAIDLSTPRRTAADLDYLLDEDDDDDMGLDDMDLVE